MSAALEERARLLEREGRTLAANSNIETFFARAGSMFCIFFHPGEVSDYEAVQQCDTERFSRYFHAMLNQGIYLAPSQFEAGFVSQAHSEEDIDKTLKAMKEAFRRC